MQLFFISNTCIVYLYVCAYTYNESVVGIIVYMWSVKVDWFSRQVPASVLLGVIPTSPFIPTPPAMMTTPTLDREAAEKAKRMSEVSV